MNPAARIAAALNRVGQTLVIDSVEVKAVMNVQPVVDGVGTASWIVTVPASANVDVGSTVVKGGFAGTVVSASEVMLGDICLARRLWVQ